MELSEVYVIKNKEGLYATYGRSEFKKELRFARLYKSKETALRHYFNNTGNYEGLTLVKLKINVISEEKMNPSDFKESR